MRREKRRPQRSTVTHRPTKNPLWSGYRRLNNLRGLCKHGLDYSHVISRKHYGLFHTCVTNLINLLYSTMCGSKFRNVTFMKFKLDEAQCFLATLPFQRAHRQKDCQEHKRRLNRSQSFAFPLRIH